ncbi:MAG: hypothetical protein ACRDTH_03225 [Pseudonocardiaceae bacterium]
MRSSTRWGSAGCRTSGVAAICTCSRWASTLAITAFLFNAGLLAALVMIAGGLVAVFFGVAAERQSLEDVTPPLAAIGRGGPGST